MPASASEEPFVDLLRQSFSLVRQRREKTVLEIAGIAERENYISNILAYLFNPHQEHGLGTLLLEQLLSVAGSKCTSHAAGLTVEFIQREFATKQNKRIDIFIRTTERIVVIENKINHHCDNPWSEYASCAEDHSEGRVVDCILIHPDYNRPPAETGRFVRVSYGKFFEAVSEAIEARDLRPPTCLRELMTTMLNSERNRRLNQDLMDLLSGDNFATFVKLRQQADDLAHDLRKSVEKFDEAFQRIMPAGLTRECFVSSLLGEDPTATTVYDSVCYVFSSERREHGRLQVWKDAKGWGAAVYSEKWKLLKELTELQGEDFRFRCAANDKEIEHFAKQVAEEFITWVSAVPTDILGL